MVERLHILDYHTCNSFGLHINVKFMGFQLQEYTNKIRKDGQRIH
jgi:hypothetical protein